MAAAVAAALRGHPGTEHGRERLAIGAGGDRTSRVDTIAEDAVLAVCERLAAGGARFTVRSEEVGERWFGAELPVLLVDPVDGSMNAMFGLPYYCTSIALLDGGRIGDIAAGVVRNLAGGGTYTAVRGGGAEYEGRPITPLTVALDARGRIPMVLLEAHRSMGRPTGRDDDLAALLRSADRVRLLGSSALSLCMAATGAASVLVAPDGMRAYDFAAGLLVLRECGGIVTDIDGRVIDGEPAAFDERTALVASLSPTVHRRALDLLAGR